MKTHRHALKTVPALILALLLCTASGTERKPNIAENGNDSGTSSVNTIGTLVQEAGVLSVDEEPEGTAERDGRSVRVPRESLAVKRSESLEEARAEDPEAVPKKPIPKVKPDKIPDLPLSSYSLPYIIRVNREANCVTVYRGDGTTPVRSFVCSCGPTTPLGTFRITAKYTWGELFNNSWGQYSSRLGSYDLHILIHSTPYMQTRKGFLRTEEYDKLGTSASMGCVRMTVADCKWVFDNCPNGTLVEIYDDPYPGPLGKPVFRKIGNAPKQYCFWDPTDPDYRNPWLSVEETIEQLYDHVTVMAGTEPDLASYVRAYDEFGTEIPYVTYGTVEPYVPGDYEIVYKLTSGKDMKKLVITVKK